MKRLLFALLLPAILIAGCTSGNGTAVTEKTEEIMWKTEFARLLPLLGHRNWILVVDQAYPLQSGSGIVTLDTKESMEEVLKIVLGEIDAAPHIKPIIYTDLEMNYLDEVIAPGMTEVKEQHDRALAGRGVQTIPHEEVFIKIDAASELFQTVVLKTTSRIAYSSVFIELDCGYWTTESEMVLREKINLSDGL